MILTQWKGIPRPNKSFNSLYLDGSESLISTFNSAMSSHDFDTESGRLHLCTRSIIFEPMRQNLPLIKFKITNHDFKFKFTQIASTPASTSPSNIITRSHGSIKTDRASKTYDKFKTRRSSMLDRAGSPRTALRYVKQQQRALQRSVEGRTVLVIQVERFVVSNRDPCEPAFTQNSKDNFMFDLEQDEVSRIAAELDMMLRAGDEETSTSFIYGVRYKDFVNNLPKLEDFNPEEFLLQHKARRVLPEGNQSGVFVLTQVSFHFYSILNVSQNPNIHIKFRSIRFAQRHRYLFRHNGILIHTYTENWPILIIFETEEQRENIFAFLQKRVKFANPMDELERMQEKWRFGNLTNFEYIMFVNSLAGRTCLDLSSFPVFPWVLNDYHSEDIDLTNRRVYRDLSKHVGQLNDQRFYRYQASNEDRKERGDEEYIFPGHYSNPSHVIYYLMRLVPEFMIHKQNDVYAPSDKFFKNVEQSWKSSLVNFSDVKELTPDFYAGGHEFLLNLQAMEFGGDEAVTDVELPPWASSPQIFIEKMREALESDIVSESLH